MSRGLPAVVLALGLATAVAAGAQGLVVTPEPGVALPGGGALVPFHAADSSGVPFPVRTGELVAESEGGGYLSAELVAFGGTSAEPFALEVLLDPAALKNEDSAAWATQLQAFLGGGPGREVRSAHVAGSHFTPLAAADVGSPEAVRERWNAAGDGPLWDRVLQSLDSLSNPGPAARRVLLLVTNGEEAKESRHPVVTCVDAADSARVSVWIVAPHVPGAAVRARLASLATRTGGGLVLAEGSSASAFGTALGRIRAAQALRISSLPQPAPLAVTLRPGVAGAAPVRAWIRERRPLGLVRPPFPWVPLVATLVLAALVGAVVWIRHRSIGRVRGVTGIAGTFRVTHAGLTIGGAVGNGLVLADPRVSRHHAVIRREGGRTVLVDLRSSNGTKVNGRAISSAALRNGDRIVFADAFELVWEE